MEVLENDVKFGIIRKKLENFGNSKFKKLEKFNFFFKVTELRGKL